MDLKSLIKKIQEKDPHFHLDTYLDDFLPNRMMQSQTLQKAFGITDPEMEAIYREGFACYEKNEMVNAENAFHFLVLLNPFIATSWMALGASQMLLERLEKALHSYAIAALLDPNDPEPHFYAHECLMKQGKVEEAKKALKLAEKREMSHA